MKQKVENGLLSVLIADDHSVVRKGLKQILLESFDIGSVDEAENGIEALELIHTRDYDVLVLDISMPGPSGIDILKKIKAESRNLPVLILSMHAEERYAVRALKAGAAGYLCKSSAPDELVKAIKKVVLGGTYLSPEQSEKIASRLYGDGTPSRHEQLSNREYQVLLMLSSGKSITEISRDLDLNVKTVSTYRTRILKKMDLASNAQLTKYAIQSGLVD